MWKDLGGFKTFCCLSTWVPFSSDLHTECLGFCWKKKTLCSRLNPQSEPLRMLFIKWWLVIFQRYSRSDTRFVYVLIIKTSIFIHYKTFNTVSYLKCKHWQMYFKQIQFKIYIYIGVWNILLYSNTHSMRILWQLAWWLLC